jgi:undecaprenyl-diphosphatase
MDFLLLLKAAIMGIVEGLTEFLPISSTGHLIVAGSLLNFNYANAKVFEIVIQSGAILALCWEYRQRLLGTVSGIFTEPKAQRFALNVSIAFLPFMLMALKFHEAIKAELFKPVPVALAFALGGVIILFAERWYKNRAQQGHVKLIESVDDMTWRDALKVGFTQCVALIPGTSRSGATIIGGMFLGLSRKCATEFTFFLAIPTLMGATVYALWKARNQLAMADLSVFGVGFVTAFISAFICVRWLLRYISTHDFTVFAWYRIAFGVVILATSYSGLVTWN